MKKSGFLKRHRIRIVPNPAMVLFFYASQKLYPERYLYEMYTKRIAHFRN